jgi:hypothetical protein
MSYSPFHRISRHEKGADFITVSESQTVLIKGIKYRKAWTYNLGQSELDHYIISQAPCNKLCVGNVWYVQLLPHKCEFNCIDGNQTDKQWIDYLRVSPNKRLVRNVLRAMEKFGYHNAPTKGDKKIG